MSEHHLTRKVAVAGATGKLGQLIIKHLLSHRNVEVHALARHPNKLPADLTSNSRLKVSKCNLWETASIREAIKGCMILISTVRSDPGSEIAMQKAMVDACVREHVPRFMPSEFTLDWRCIDLDLIPQKKANQEIYEYISNQEGKLEGVHILTGGFMETLFAAGFWYTPGADPSKGLSAWGTGDEIWELTSYDNTAQYTAAVALDPKATGFYRFVGDRLSIKEIAKTLEETYDLPPIPINTKGSLADLKRQVKAGIEEDIDSQNFWDWKGQSYCLFLTNGQGYLEMPLNNNEYAGEIMQETLETWLEGKKLEELGSFYGPAPKAQ